MAVVVAYEEFVDRKLDQAKTQHPRDVPAGGASVIMFTGVRYERLRSKQSVRKAGDGRRGKRGTLH